LTEIGDDGNVGGCGDAAAARLTPQKPTPLFQVPIFTCSETTKGFLLKARVREKIGRSQPILIVSW
jgi:hypothetical protein